MSCANNRGSGEGSLKKNITKIKILTTNLMAPSCMEDECCILIYFSKRASSLVLVLYSSGMQQIYDQIQKRLEDRNMQDEMKKYEREQIQEKQEKMNLEDFKVRHTQRKHTNTKNQNFDCPLDWLSLSRPWRRRGRSNRVCRTRTCASMLRPHGPRSRGERRRSWLT